MDAALRIFLNYRRDDSSGHAGRLYDDLTERLGDYDVFIDIDKIDPGADFVDVIENALDSCDVVLALIGRQWLSITDARGQRRIEDPNDYVRLELEAALARGMRVIPVRVQGSAMPSSVDLPEGLRSLARRQAVELSDTRWHHDVGALVTKLEDLSAAAGERARAEREALERQETHEEAERARSAREESERLRAEQARAEHERKERERAEQEEARRLRAARERAERDRKERERAEQDEARRLRAAQVRAERERKERERVERERAKRGRAAEEHAERERRARVRREQGQRWDGLLAGGIEGQRHRLVVAGAAVAVLVVLGIALAVILRDGGAGTTPENVASRPAPGTRKAGISGTLRAGNTLTVRRGTWSGSPTQFAYEWRRCSRAGDGCRVILGADSPRYRLVGEDVGKRIRASVAASNEAGSRTTVTTATVVVAPALARPLNSSPPRISGLSREGSKLTSTPGRWSGTKPIEIGLVWLRCNPQGGGCEPIVGARGLSYRLQEGDVGQTLRVEARASSAAGRGVARSSATSVVRAPPAQTETTTPQPTQPETTTTTIEPVDPPPDP